MNQSGTEWLHPTEGSAAAPTIAEISLADLLPARETIGPYRILRTLGEGGMGTVYLGERMDGEIERRVAIKVISVGSHLPIVHQRFRSERQILAELDHPSIARLYDAGTTPDGRSYLVMEVVEGVPIDRYCAEHDLGFDERIQLMRRVCAAVDHAHRRLIVHRDLKPSNILVTKHGVPKLLDFGIAKLLDPDSFPVPLDEETQTALRPLTPRFASPEQVYGGQITTASDVWALGVLLHRLLTGGYPFPASSRTAQSLLISMRRPPEPAHRTLRRRLERKRRIPWSRSTVRRVTKRLRGDVQSILAKALRFEPEERYGTVSAFEEDLRRLIYQEPVRARRPTLDYRLEKFVKRHKRGVLAVSTVSLLVSALMVFAVDQAAESRKQARRAEQAKEVFASMLWAANERLESDGTVPWEELLSESRERLTRSSDLDGAQRFEILLLIAGAQAQGGREEKAVESLEASLRVAPDRCPDCRREAERWAPFIYQRLWDADPDAAAHFKQSFFASGLLSKPISGELQRMVPSLRGRVPQIPSEVSRQGFSVEVAGLDDAKLLAWLVDLERRTNVVTVLQQRGRPDVAALLLSRLLPHACSATDRGSCEMLLYLAGDVLLQAEELEGCDLVYQKLLEGIGDPVPVNEPSYINGLMARAACSSGPTAERRFDEVEQLIRERLARDPDHLRARYQLARSFLFRALVAEREGHAVCRRRALAEALERLERLSAERDVLYIENSRAMALLLAGRVDEGRALVGQLEMIGWRREDLMRLARMRGVVSPSEHASASAEDVAPDLVRRLEALEVDSPTDPSLAKILESLEAIASRAHLGARRVQ